MDWHLSADGSQSPVLSLPGDLMTLRLTTSWYVDPATGIMGPVETTLPPRLVRIMLTCPAIPPDLVALLLERIALLTMLGRNFPLPEAQPRRHSISSNPSTREVRPKLPQYHHAGIAPTALPTSIRLKTSNIGLLRKSID